MDRPKIVRVEALADYQVRIDSIDGVTGIVAMRQLIDHGGVFAPMADPEFFARVRVGEIGRSIEWPGEIDFCPDTLTMKIETAAIGGTHVAWL